MAISSPRTPPRRTPPRFSTSTLAAGTHTAQATAVDNGTPALSASSSVTFTVQGGGGNTPPVVNLTAPTSGQVFPAGTTTVNLTATASDPGGAVQRVEFRVGTTLVGTDTTSPYTATATGLTAGTFTATATAFDNGVPTPVMSAASSAHIHDPGHHHAGGLRDADDVVAGGWSERHRDVPVELCTHQQSGGADHVARAAR